MKYCMECSVAFAVNVCKSGVRRSCRVPFSRREFEVCTMARVVRIRCSRSLPSNEQIQPHPFPGSSIFWGKRRGAMDVFVFVNKFSSNQCQILIQSAPRLFFYFSPSVFVTFAYIRFVAVEPIFSDYENV